MNFEIVQNIAIYPLAFEIMDETSVSRDRDRYVARTCSKKLDFGCGYLRKVRRANQYSSANIYSTQILILRHDALHEAVDFQGFK